MEINFVNNIDVDLTNILSVVIKKVLKYNKIKMTKEEFIKMLEKIEDDEDYKKALATVIKTK